MVSRKIADQHLQCARCGAGFVFTAGEQEFYALRGVSPQPKQCPSCLRGPAQRFGPPKPRLQPPPF